MTNSSDAHCPCGSSQPYTVCCGPYIEQATLPKTPEQLMRSRYTAFTQGNAEYIGNTMRNQALKQYDANATREWALSLKWDRLEILCAPPVPDHTLTGVVHFIAHYFEHDEPQEIEEWSEFTQIQGQWYYTSTLKMGRNDPCLCDSGKKYKKCCAL